MIDFALSDGDQKVLAETRKQALVVRGYARYYDENEHEFPPDRLPEADEYPNVFSLLGGRD